LPLFDTRASKQRHYWLRGVLDGCAARDFRLRLPKRARVVSSNKARVRAKPRMLASLAQADRIAFARF